MSTSYHYGWSVPFGHGDGLGCARLALASTGKHGCVTIGVSLLLIAVGAILVWGVSAEAEGLNVDAIGVILMIVGLVGGLLSMILWTEWSPVYRGRRRTYVEGEAPVRRRAAPRREVIVEEEDVAPPALRPPDPP
jgi:hypothetical protein